MTQVLIHLKFGSSTFEIQSLSNLGRRPSPSLSIHSHPLARVEHNHGNPVVIDFGLPVARAGAGPSRVCRPSKAGRQDGRAAHWAQPESIIRRNPVLIEFGSESRPQPESLSSRAIEIQSLSISGWPRRPNDGPIIHQNRRPRNRQKRPTIERSMLPLTFLRDLTVPNTVIIKNPRSFERRNPST